MGSVKLSGALTASAQILSLLALDPSLSSSLPQNALYLDTETTGLSGGSGTLAFLIGLAFWQDDELVIEQLFVPNFGRETPALAHLSHRMAKADLIVTYNGKSFDLPLLRTRFAMNRSRPPREPPHLDLLHVARRIHRARNFEMRLVSLEEHILGFRRQDDVVSADIGAIYTHFVRTGDPKELFGVVEHNVWDVMAMVALVALYGERPEHSDLPAEDMASVARTFGRARDFDFALLAAEKALSGGATLQGLKARAELSKARGERDRALSDFSVLEKHVSDPETRLELAKLHEHFVKDFAQALEFAKRGTGESDAQVLRRVERLERKQARQRDTRNRKDPSR